MTVLVSFCNFFPRTRERRKIVASAEHWKQSLALSKGHDNKFNFKQNSVQCAILPKIVQFINSYRFISSTFYLYKVNTKVKPVSSTWNLVHYDINHGFNVKCTDWQWHVRLPGTTNVYLFSCRITSRCCLSSKPFGCLFWWTFSSLKRKQTSFNMNLSTWRKQFTLFNIWRKQKCQTAIKLIS